MNYMVDQKRKDIKMTNGYNIGKIMGLVNTVKGDLYLIENLIVNENPQIIEKNTVKE